MINCQLMIEPFHYFTYSNNYISITITGAALTVDPMTILVCKIFILLILNVCYKILVIKYLKSNIIPCLSIVQIVDHFDPMFIIHYDVHITESSI